MLDDHGDENDDALPEEIHKCIAKIAKREPSLKLSKHKLRSLRLPVVLYDHESGQYLYRSLYERFQSYHQRRKTVSNGAHDFSTLTGVDFETYVANRLKDAGYDVAGTPASGDQGADLIAKKNGKTIAIQAKEYKGGTVGNGAVQEIVGALRFYGANEGWVITSSTFTPFARSLAQANNIRLIDCHDLRGKQPF